MKRELVFVVVFLGLALMVSANARSPMSVLKAAQHLSRFSSPPASPLAFSWANCGAASDPTVLLSLQVKPDPIVFGQNISITTKFYLSETISAGDGHTVSLEIYKKFFGAWVYVPCVEGVGSCTIGDLCSKIHVPSDHGCPLAPYGLPCSCPFKPNTYTIPPPGLNIHLKNPNLSWLTDGDFWIKATLNDRSGKRLSCYQIVASLST